MLNTCENILRPLRGIFVVFLKVFWYCCRNVDKWKVTDPNYENTTLLLANDNQNEDNENEQPSGPLLAFSGNVLSITSD